MPWCDDCSKFWNPPQLAEGGTCPTCGRSLATPAYAAARTVEAGGSSASPVTPRAPASRSQAGPGAAAAGGPAEPEVKGAPKAKGAPWHFKVLVVGVTIYMIYRIYWLIEWLPKHI